MPIMPMLLCKMILQICFVQWTKCEKNIRNIEVFLTKFLLDSILAQTRKFFLKSSLATKKEGGGVKLLFPEYIIP